MGAHQHLTDKYKTFTREQLLELLETTHQQLSERTHEVTALTQAVQDWEKRFNILQEQLVVIQGQYVLLKSKYFGRSSERKGKGTGSSSTKKKSKDRSSEPKLPSERYPNAPLVETHVTYPTPPNCELCQSQLSDSGMSEDSEFLEIIPKQIYIVRQMRHVYRCSTCHGCMKTAPLPPRIKPGSAYGDSMILDVALSKYCDLIPIERYATIAGREGFKDLPPHSLIETSHALADLARPAAKLVEEQVLADVALNADETPHNMLEGSPKKTWQLWGFSNRKSIFFHIRDTRSGTVAAPLLVKSACLFLTSDVFSGYSKAVADANALRAAQGKPLIQCAYCNAHARRKFKDASQAGQMKPEDPVDPEMLWFVEQYEVIYVLESQTKDLSPEGVLEVRAQMRPRFEAMKNRAEALSAAYSDRSAAAKALRYFLKNYRGFTLFLSETCLGIDNNILERSLRNPVVGRKTWLGTHSERGAETAAILFTLVESCKMIELNPREYFSALVKSLLSGKPAFTPLDYKTSQSLAQTA
jgi:transposase